ncbi:MAG TPA: lipopolysaccharide heptosyltransferase I [Terracidiphilus sp.]|nr:lipopolysaccharide heptosyltransferase I [Terracidiphilus sp.]
MHTQSKYRLLVVRLGAMGDILHALPAVTALRQMHPSWVIGWVVEPRWRGLLAAPGAAGRGEAMPVVDRLHFAPTREWRAKPMSMSTLRGIQSLRRELRSVGYDAVIDLQGAIRSAVVGRMASRRRVIGEAAPREGIARWFFTERVPTHGAHVIEQDFELAQQIAGDELEPIPPQLPVDTAAEAWCDDLLRSSGERPVALINPGAGWGAKRWPVERYAAVARGLMARGLRVLVNAGPGEEPMADVIVKEASGAAIPLAMSLDQLIAVTRRVAICIAGDTGPLHLACALGRPVVGIYGPTDPSRNGPYGTRFRVLRSPESRRDHTRRPEPEAGLLTIAPEEVLKAADELLNERNPNERNIDQKNQGDAQ